MAPWTKALGKECFLISDLSSSTALKLSKEALSRKKNDPLFSWKENERLLSCIKAESEEEKGLPDFLKNRWLSKANGYFPFATPWVCPCFGFDIQMHPESNSSYARDPCTKYSGTYASRLKERSGNFPLILTRPADISSYLPHFTPIETVQEAKEMFLKDPSALLDFSPLLNNASEEVWESLYRYSLAKELKGAVCIQRGAGGEWLRILPIGSDSGEQAHGQLLEWVSIAGLSSTFVELNRPHRRICDFSQQIGTAAAFFPEKEAFFCYLKNYEWMGEEPKKLLVQGLLSTLKGLFTSAPEKSWGDVLRSKTKREIASLCFCRIREKLEMLKKEDAPFYDTFLTLEQVHENLSCLLEILSPFEDRDFQGIYADLLEVLDQRFSLSCQVHASGMTSFSAILKAVEESRGKFPRVIYGENLYFEAREVLERISDPIAGANAAREDWREADALFVQFNPVLKRGDPSLDAYREERVLSMIRKALAARTKPLTVALDCTIDYIYSDRVKEIVQEFETPIASGALNLLCYRSGLKFDLFGMDNFAGAPFYMLDNGEEKWSPFQRLISDPALRTDRLSFNWFCLAYCFSAPYLDTYRRQIFENTREVLSRIPKRLFSPNSPYRIVPIEESGDAAFIDVKVSGFLHPLRASSCVGGSLYVRSMESGHPIFYRRSIGLPHSNFGILFDEDESTLRLTIGLDPAQVDLYVGCFEKIDALNANQSL